MVCDCESDCLIYCICLINSGIFYGKKITTGPDLYDTAPGLNFSGDN